jgi:hypothetical protein
MSFEPLDTKGPCGLCQGLQGVNRPLPPHEYLVYCGQEKNTRPVCKPGAKYLCVLCMTQLSVNAVAAGVCWN